MVRVLCFLICVETCLKHKFPIIFFSDHKRGGFFFISPNQNKLLTIQNNGKYRNLYSEVKCFTILCIHHTFFLETQTLHLPLQKDMGEQKNYPKLDVVPEGRAFLRKCCFTELCREQGHLHAGRREGIPAL